MDTSETSSYKSSSDEEQSVSIAEVNAEIAAEAGPEPVVVPTVDRPIENIIEGLHEETKESVNKNKKKKKKGKANVAMDSDDGGENTCTYKSCKTKNEIDPDMAWQVGPEALDLDHLDEILPFGTIVQYIT
jgi:hypothetical protein